MIPEYKETTFEEAWACLRQPGSQWVTAILSRKLNPGPRKSPRDEAVILPSVKHADDHR